ncbi:SMP-30/gluconolactonase/LRE family protein [Nocardioides sp. R-C-SC26]|uniref:SMP-30/gluconolactonase/LRE family protein n=1 Tax=Nocardioides sp. R-C-SC26 TaxID=2870414 RepID=UPI001E3F9B4B|nr:SMP-30/gluconolactonase/LRE family protein [Nocardioides sp. R-C-SC26]
MTAVVDHGVISLLRPARVAVAVIAATTALVAGPAPTGASAAPPAPCATWRASGVADGLGTLENLSFDGRGGLLLSAGQAGGGAGDILRLTPSGRTEVIVPDVAAPGGHVVVGRRLFFTTGNGFADGLLGDLGYRRGTLSVVDLDTRKVRVLARKLAMPNGLVRLPDGSFLASRDLGLPGRTTRLYRDGRRDTFAPSVTSTNGMAVDAERRLVYLVSTFNPTSTISVVDLRRPDRTPRVITLDGFGPANAADEITLGADGQLYVTLNVAGKVVRVDPASGRQCTIASGIPFASSLRFGAGRGWDRDSLYVTDFLGSVTRLRPPA